MKKLLITGLVTLVAVAGIATATVSAAPAQEPLRLTWGLPCTEASETSIPKEEARQIGLNALAVFFGADLGQLGNYVIEIGYNPAIDLWESMTSEPMYGIDGNLITIDDLPDYHFPMNVHRSTWHGTVSIPNDRMPCPEGRMLRSSDLFRFSLDAQTGEVVALQFFPSEDPVARPNKQRECMGSPKQVFEYRNKMTAQHNIEFANRAMQVATQAGIFEGEVLRATTLAGGWSMGRGESFELVIAVAIESTTGETATITLQGRNRKELVAVDFYSRRVDHAIDREGNITEPASPFSGSPQLANWIYQ